MALLPKATLGWCCAHKMVCLPSGFRRDHFPVRFVNKLKERRFSRKGNIPWTTACTRSRMGNPARLCSLAKCMYTGKDVGLGTTGCDGMAWDEAQRRLFGKRPPEGYKIL